MRMFVDGAVALCIRVLQVDGSTLDQWYGLFILRTELDDERLMRLRLERLLCWRESPERWLCYQHMPPVLYSGAIAAPTRALAACGRGGRPETAP